jgi:hypothetical protein
MAIGRKKISELPAAQGIQNVDMLPVSQPDKIDPATQQQGVTSKVTFQQLAQYMSVNDTVIDKVWSRYTSGSAHRSPGLSGQSILPSSLTAVVGKH